MKSRAPWRSRRIVSVLIAGLVIGLAGLVLPGCGDKTANAPTGDTPEVATGPGAGPVAAPSTGTAQDILERMILAYRGAKSYRDTAIVQLSGTQNGERQQIASPHAVVMERPNKIRLQIDNGTLLCDGTSTYGFARDLPGQVLKIPAADQISIKSVYPDVLLARAMAQSPTQSFSWVPLQLMLLLAGDPMKTLAQNTQSIDLMAPAMIDQYSCDRVRLATSNGPGVLWIDQAKSILRRFEVPVEALRQEAAAQNFLDPAITVEYIDAQLDVPIDPKAFLFQLPPDQGTVEVMTPPPLQVLGKPCPDFQFTDMKGDTVALSSLQGKIVVMQLWTSKIVNCQPALQEAGKTLAALENRDDVMMLALNLEEENVQDASLQTVLKDWGVDLPIYRDKQQSIASHFGIAGLPVTIVVDKKGNLQLLYPGSPEVTTIESLQAGEDVYKRVFAQFEEERAGFDAFVEQSIADNIFCPQAAIPRTQVSPRTEPTHLKMTKLWSCEQLKYPGNIAVVPGENGSPRILVIDGGTSAVELNVDGSIAATHVLELESNELVMVLRTAVAGDGKRYFLGSARGVQRVHLFDENLKTLLVYPDSQHPGIGDVQLADLDGNGTLEMILAYAGAAGVHAVDLQGKRLWADRSMVDAIRVATLTPDDAGQRNVLAMNGAVGGGTLIELDSQGKRLREISAAEHSIGWVVADDLDSDGTSEICILALAIAADGRPASETIDTAGIDLDGQILWKHPIARAVHRQQIEPVITGNVLPSGPNQWLIAAADSTISVIAADGQLVERFAYGAELSGLATARWDGKTVLLVATTQAVEAWQVEPLQAPATPAASPDSN